MTAPANPDPVAQGSAHVRALVDDIVGQLARYLRDDLGSTKTANALEDAPVAINTRAWLEALFAVTHPDRVVLPRVRLDEVDDNRYPLGQTVDDEPLFVKFYPASDGNVRVQLVTGSVDDGHTISVISDAEGARMTFLAGLAMAVHQHPAFGEPNTDDAEQTSEQSEQEVSPS